MVEHIHHKQDIETAGAGFTGQSSWLPATPPASETRKGGRGGRDILHTGGIEPFARVSRASWFLESSQRYIRAMEDGVNEAKTLSRVQSRPEKFLNIESFPSLENDLPT